MRIIVILIVCLLSACSTVRFNERERLLDYDMQFDPDPLHALIDGHVRNPRQGAVGAFSASGGGGCGCY